MTYPLHITDIPYATHSRLNTLDIWLPRPLDESPADAVWVVYIHGGAWRDPLIAASSIRPTIDHLERTSSPALPRIAAVASLHYRLSPYPSHPTHPTSLPPHSVEAALEGRNVAHPAHKLDVLDALAWLKRVYGVGAAKKEEEEEGRGYVLVGHSCGATLALQVLPELAQAQAGALLPGMPKAVAGIAGIYDIKRFAANHVDVPVYAEILAGAFGGGAVDEAMKDKWASASPVRVVQGEVLERLGRLLLAQSRADALVEWEQVDLMMTAAAAAEEGKKGGGARGAQQVQVLEIEGQHDECWEKGEGVARVVETLLEGL